MAQIAGAYLARQLHAQSVVEIDPRQFFEPRSIAVKAGIGRAEALPRSVFYTWHNPAGPRDLVILIGDQQPNRDGFRYASTLIEIAKNFAVERVVTFAAMATPIHPGDTPRVFGVATRESLVPDLARQKVTMLEEGEISGLNGTFLAAAEAHELPAFCLLGEFPFFAAQVPNPKASAAVLEVFGRMSGIAIDLAPIRSDAEKLENELVHHFEELKRAAQLAAEQGESDEGIVSEEPEAPKAPAERPPPKEILDRIEALFSEAGKDRGKALELKAELDRFGLFKRFEDRFLDLFKKAG